MKPDRPERITATVPPKKGRTSSAAKSTPLSRPRKPTGVTYQIARELACRLPGVEDGTSYGTPSLKVRGKFLLRLREDGETLAVKVDYPMREALMQAEPETFFITDHYRNYPAVLVRLASVDRKRLHEVLEHAWRFVAQPAASRSSGRKGSARSSAMRRRNRS
jgi:hypothetical protein